MKKSLTGIAALALTAAMPASAQILGGGGGLGGTVGGLGGSIGGTLDTTVRTGDRLDTVTRTRESVRAERALRARERAANVHGDALLTNNARLGERRIETRNYASADAGLSLSQRMLRTRGAVAATRRGLRNVRATASGIPVFVPTVALPAPRIPRVAVPFPEYSASYYYGPGAVFVGSGYVETYMDHQYQDMEASLRGTGATVERRGDDLVVFFPADVTFAFDKDEIRPRFFGPLSAFARTINQYPGTDIEIAGHTDAVGSETYNLSLSERRGRSVAEFLAAQQVTPARMVVEGLGESEPVASNKSEQGRAANRRVELIVHPRAG